MTKTYFIDRDHAIITEYYDFLDSAERASTQKTKKKMQHFITKNPDFFDPYLILFGIYQNENALKKADAILKKAFDRAMAIITDKKGNWPDEMLWLDLENRHIIRTILNKALNSWIKGNTVEALDLLRKLLRSNPHDNIGARNYILAIRLGMTFGSFEKKMMREYGYDAIKMLAFEEKMKDFPDEFDWWFQATKE